MAKRTATFSLPPDLLPALGLDSFVAFDVETTGLDPAYDRIIEVGAARFQDGREVAHFESFLHYSRPLPAAIRSLTGIKDEMLAEAPAERRVLPDLLKFIGDDPLAGHHISFDLGFLQAGAARLGLPDQTQRPCADSALLARVLLPMLPSRSLTSLGRYFNVNCDERHRALSDARRTGEVLLHLLSYFPRVELKSVDLLRRIADELDHPSAGIFSAWSNYLMRSASLESGFRPFQLAGLRDNILGKLAPPKNPRERSSEDNESDSHDQIPEKEVEKIFASEGTLARYFSGFEFRPEQMQMAVKTSQVFNRGGILAVEAGTGVGKSLAYLVPAIFWAQANSERCERVIVSTNTINLQEQLFYKDLPLLSEVISEPFCAVLQKGRNNYLCRSRWENLVTEHPLRLSNSERLALLSLVLWAGQTRSGDIAEVSAFHGEGANTLWSRLASEGGACRGRRCQEALQNGRCFHSRIRAAAARAHVVIVNHALLLADLAAEHVPLGAYSTLVVDEAHHLEKAAAQQLGKELTFWGIRFWSNRAYDPEGVTSGLLARILLGSGAALTDHPLLPGFKNSLEETANRVITLKRVAEDFFQHLTSAVRQEIPATENGYTQKLRLREPAAFLRIGELAEVPLLISLKAAEESLRQAIAVLLEIPVAALPRAEEWRDELGALLEELQQIKETFVFYFAPPDGNWVYWAELPRKQEHHALLYAAPLNAGEILREQLLQPLRSVILTSATLTVTDRFHYFLRKIGLKEAENVAGLQLGSPFHYQEQMLIGLPAFLPSPRHPNFEFEMTQMLLETINRLPRGTLGLFTSHRMLQAVSRSLEQASLTRPLLVQGQGAARDQLLRQFREQPGSILLGTDSFWEGIDVVGEALELLLVAKLPFEVPSEPLVEARLEKLKAEGKDPFLYYTVPEAIIRLRQGIGRLIRSRTDRGAAIICDSRLINSRYGEAFLQSLPLPVKIFADFPEMIQELESFFAAAPLRKTVSADEKN